MNNRHSNARKSPWVKGQNPRLKLCPLALLAWVVLKDLSPPTCPPPGPFTLLRPILQPQKYPKRWQQPAWGMLWCSSEEGGGEYLETQHPCSVAFLWRWTQRGLVWDAGTLAPSQDLMRHSPQSTNSKSTRAPSAFKCVHHPFSQEYFFLIAPRGSRSKSWKTSFWTS